MGLLSSLFGGSSSSSSQNTTNTDARAVLGERAVYAREGATVNLTTTDGRAFDVATAAVQEVADLAKLQDTSAAELFQRALDFAQASSDTASTAINQAAQYTREAYAESQGRGANTDKLLFAAMGAVVLVAFLAARGTR